MANQTGRYTTTYDSLQRRRTVVTPAGKVITYSYDSLSRKSQMNVADAGIFTYSYDANNQLVVLQNPQNDRTTFSYNNAGRRILKELANGTRATMLYDAAGNMTRIANLKSNNSVISQFDYIYDPVGNKIQIATSNGSLTTYSYDAIYNLTQEHRTGPNPYQNTYTYDPTGNRILTIKDGARTTSTFDPANQNVYSLDTTGRTTYIFDSSGNRTVVLKPDGSRTTTSYDYENRDIRVHLPSDLRNTMAYDPDGLRVLLQDSSGTRKFVYDNQQYLLHTDSSNVVIAVQTQEPGTYSNLISQYQFDGSIWLPSYYHYDSLGNTSELTNVNEDVTDTYDYNAWGELLTSTGTTLNPFQYRGRHGYFANTDTGDIYVIMRTYDPGIGRWTTLDVLRFINGMNMYRAYFVPGGVDPSGLVNCPGGAWYFSGDKTGGEFIAGYYYARARWVCAQREEVAKITWCCCGNIFVQRRFRIAQAAGSMLIFVAGIGAGGSWKGIAGTISGVSNSDSLGGWSWGGLSTGITLGIVGVGAGWAPGSKSGEAGIEPGLGATIVQTSAVKTNIWSSGYSFEDELLSLTNRQLLQLCNDCSSNLTGTNPPVASDNPNRPIGFSSPD